MARTKKRNRARDKMRTRRQRESRKKKAEELKEARKDVSKLKNDLALTRAGFKRVKTQLLLQQRISQKFKARCTPRTTLSTLHLPLSTAVQPTPTSKTLTGGTSSELKLCVKMLDRYALRKSNEGEVSCLGKGTFGQCTKMIMSSIHVAVKTYDPSMSTRNDIINESKIMQHLCRGHPNLPVFIGLYDFTNSLPQLVTAYYSVDNKSLTLHKLITGSDHEHTFTTAQWASILMGIVSAIEKIHECKYLHNDIKGDNIVMSDIIPQQKYPPPLSPVLIDYGKSRPMSSPKVYHLNKDEKAFYRTHYCHIAPELIDGVATQSQKSDVYSVGRIIRKVACLTGSQGLKAVATKCLVIKPELRPNACGLYSMISELLMH